MLLFARRSSKGPAVWAASSVRPSSSPASHADRSQDHDHSTGNDQQTDHEHPEAGPDRPGELDSSISLDVDAPSCIGVHHDRRPATELGVPRDRLLAGALGPGDPEVLLAGWRPWRSAPVQVEHGVAAVEVDQLVVGDITEVTIDFVVGSDADEHRFFASTWTRTLGGSYSGPSRTRLRRDRSSRW